MSTLNSLIAQSHKDIDITIIDDASIDDTVKVIENYCKDERVRIIKNKENLGLTKNWNRCLELAEGPLVQIMQSDDLLDATYLERVNNIFEMYPQIGFVSAACRYIDGSGELIDSNIEKPDCIYKAGDEAVAAILTNGFPHVSSIIMRKFALKKIGKINEEIWHGPDVEFDARMASQLNYYKIGKIYTSFRRHGTNRGNMEYFRKDYLSNHILKMNIAFGYLSDYGRQKIGVRNISAYITQDAARMAIGGAIMMVAYGKRRLGRYYLAKAIKLDPGSIFILKFWKAVGLNLIPNIGQRFLMNRFNFTSQDLMIITKSNLK